nr:4-hydroxy-tetrahydrodipicolinate reductase [Thermomonas sp.]
MSEATIRLLVHGGNGRMGQALQRLGDATAGCRVVAAVSRQAGARVVEGIPQFAASELAGVPEFDVAIDFSLPQG